MHTLVLASQSPRRKELLEKAGFKFIIASCQISEIPNENLSLEEQIRDLAWQKAKALVESDKFLKQKGNLVLSADTVVILGRRILGKPKDRTEAADFLRRLSGQTHSVITGVCLWDLDTGRAVADHETSYVEFLELSEDQIRRYAESGEGLDKAGGYGIQGAAGAFVKELRGPFDNVMGLPVQLVERLLRENGWNVGRRQSQLGS